MRLCLLRDPQWRAPGVLITQVISLACLGLGSSSASPNWGMVAVDKAFSHANFKSIASLVWVDACPNMAHTPYYGTFMGAVNVTLHSKTPFKKRFVPARRV